MKRIFVLPLTVALLFTSGSAFAQQTTGNVTGRVLDQQKAAVPTATIVARNPQTGFTRTDTSDGQGLYRMTALAVGTYEISVSKPGFATTLRTDIDVTVAETKTIDFSLEIAAVERVVTVTAAAPPIDVTTSAVGQVVDLRRLQSLPLNGRQFANLAATLAGVGLVFHSDPTKGVNYAPSIGGGAGRNINYLIDGGDNNDDTVGGLLQQFPIEGIREFNFQTQRFKAEYGRSNGGVMNIVTKSGTNQFQGSVFELFRDKAMNALTQTEKLASSSPTKGNYRRNQFGGSFGGPLIADRAHFFFAVERTAQDTTQTVNTKGLFPASDGVFPTPYRENMSTAKVSANLSPTQYLAVRYGGNTNSFVVNASPASTPDSWADASNRFNSVNVNHNWVVGGTKLNELIFQYANYQDAILARSTADSITYSASGITTGGSLGAPQRTEQIKYQIRDDFSWHVAGRGGIGHDLKTGVNFVNEPRLFIENATGKGVLAYTIDGNGRVTGVSKSDGDGSVNIPTKQYGFYFQDDWRVSDRLTVNAGIRYDLVTGLAFDQSRNPNFVKVQAAAKAGLLNGIVGLENFGLESQSDRNNIQPRIGAVYNVKGAGKDVIRGGWGIYTDFGYTNSNVLLAALDASSTHFGQVFSATDTKNGLRNADGSAYQVGQPLSNLTNTVAPNSVPLQGFWVDPRLQQPYQLQTNIGWSHELTADTVVSVDYVNSLGRDLNYKPRLNQIDQLTGLRRISERLSSPLSPNSVSNRPVLSVGKSQYNALILAARRRLSKGVDFSASYTLSRALSTIGNASDELNTANIQNANDPFDAGVQLGPNVTTDARHRVNISAIVQLPYGVQVAPFFLYRSALPIFLVDGRDLNGDGDATDIPTEAFAVASTDAATGKSTVVSTGPCTTVNCGRGWAQSQLNLRVSKMFRAGHANIEAIGEVFNLFNAINPSNIVGATSANRTVHTSSGGNNATLLQPASYAGDTGRPEQRVGQLGVRISF